MEKTVKKINRLEQLVETTRRHYSHQNSAVIIAKQDLLLFEQAQTDRAILQLEAALESKKNQRNEIGARIAGLGEVLAVR